MPSRRFTSFLLRSTTSPRSVIQWEVHPSLAEGRVERGASVEGIRPCHPP